MSNVDERLTNFKTRLSRIETQRRELGEDIKEVKQEMKSLGLSKAEVSGVLLSVRREFESDDKKATRNAAEDIANMLGQLADLPLGQAAMANA